MFRKVMQMIQDYAEKKLLDEVFATYLDVQDAAAEMAQVLPCPRCGKLTMKMRLHSNALSRQIPGITICDQCGTEEALDAMAGKPKDAHESSPFYPGFACRTCPHKGRWPGEHGRLHCAFPYSGCWSCGETVRIY